MTVSSDRLVPGIVSVVVLLASSATAGPFTGGTVLVNSGGLIHEYDKTGGPALQEIPIPYPGAGSPAERPRGIDVGPGGMLCAYNGTLDPYVSVFDGSWAHHTRSGWSTFDDVSYGGISVFGSFAFVTDMKLSGEDSLSGLIRFDLSGASSQRFAIGRDFIDVTVGFDGLVYGLYPGGSPGGTDIDVFDPVGLVPLRSITLPSGLQLRGIAVDEAGTIYAVGWPGTIYRLDGQGNIEESVSIFELVGFWEDLVDVDLSWTCDLVMGTRFGKVIFTDTTLSPETSSHIVISGGEETFVTFTTPGPSPVRATTWGSLKNLYSR
jgi:hypothetical protein